MLLASCSQQSAAAGGEGNEVAATDVPPIHVDQTSVMFLDGHPAEEHVYKFQLDACSKSGFPTVPIAPADVDKIGRIHVEAWYDAGRSATHEETWSADVDSSAPCRFSLTHKAQTEITSADGRSTLINDLTHEADVQELGPQPTVAALDASEGQMTDADRKAGWRLLGNGRSQGADCAVWQGPRGMQLCVWSGGRKWAIPRKAPARSGMASF